MPYESDSTGADVHTDIRVRSRRPSEIAKVRKPRPNGLRNRFTTGYVLQYVCTMMWVCFFMFMALSCWILWFVLLTWLVIQTFYFCTSIVASGPMTTELLRLNFDRQTLKFCTVLLPFVTYQVYWLRDYGAEERGSHPKPWIRKLAIWRYLRDYFPINLILTDEIRLKQVPESDGAQERITCNPALFPADQNYLVGFHPHGIFGAGAFVNFATEATGFSSKFPGLTPWLTTLKLNFKAPFHRDLMLYFNIVSATNGGISYLLDPNQCGKRGNMVVIVLGGAPEALDSRPGKYVFHTNRRYGFFKLALMTGSALVPCISFGEPNMYQQIQNPPGCRLRTWQDKFTAMATFSPPIFYARMLAPYRAPVNTVVGAPIPVSLVERPSREQVAALKDLYLKNLNDLFRRYKPIYDPEADDLEFF